MNVVFFYIPFDIENKIYKNSNFTSSGYIRSAVCLVVFFICTVKLAVVGYIGVNNSIIIVFKKMLPVIFALSFSFVKVTGNVTNFNPIATILENCPIGSGINWPGEFETGVEQFTETSVQLKMDRFIAVDDLTETFTFIGALDIAWTVPCLNELFESEKWPNKRIKSIRNVNTEMFWIPDFLHRNSLADSMLPGGSDSVKRLAISLANSSIKMDYYGRFHSYCNLTFTNFPFDRLSSPSMGG